MHKLCRLSSCSRPSNPCPILATTRINTTNKSMPVSHALTLPSTSSSSFSSSISYTADRFQTTQTIPRARRLHLLSAHPPLKTKTGFGRVWGNISLQNAEAAVSTPWRRTQKVLTVADGFGEVEEEKKFGEDSETKGGSLDHSSPKRVERRHRGGSGGERERERDASASDAGLLAVPGIGPRNLRKLVDKGIGGVADLKQLYKDKVWISISAFVLF